MEANLNKLDWNPHTCACQVEITREDTVLVGEEEFAYTDQRGGKFLRDARRARTVVRNGQLKVLVPKYRTEKRSRDAIVSAVVHDVGTEPPPGTRLRGTIATPCPDHVGFSSVVQTQRVRLDFCSCVWQELIIGERKEGGFFGAIIEKVCPDHASRVAAKTLELKNLRDTVRAEAKAATELDPEA